MAYAFFMPSRITEYSVRVSDSDGDTTVLRLRAKTLAEAQADAIRRGWTLADQSDTPPPEAAEDFHKRHPIASTGLGVFIGLFAFLLVIILLASLASR